MIQVARKKRKAKASQDQEARQKPLGFAGTSTAAPEKDDEERRLESILFGTPFTPSLRGNKHEIVVDDDEGDDLESMPDETGREFANVVDEDVRLDAVS